MDSSKAPLRFKVPGNMRLYNSGNVPMQCWSDDDKPGTKILLRGSSVLSNAELLSIIIGNGNSRERSSLDAARLLLSDSHDNLGEIARSTVPELVRRGFITKTQAVRLNAAFELGRRRNVLEVVKAEKIFHSSDAYELLRSVLLDKPYEEFWIILLNRGNRVIRQKMISEGGVSGTVVDPKKVFKIALEHHACGIILGHNHPSGNIQPSESDRQITQKLAGAGKLLEITVLDHIIIADNQYYSFSDDSAL